MGEFGATITFVANIPGETQTLPSAIYTLTQIPGGDTGALRLTLISIAISMLAQQAGDADHATRGMLDDTLLARRPAPGKTAPAQRPRSTLVKGGLVGITVWRLRPSKSSEAPASRALIHEDEADRDWTPERIASDEPLNEGQKVRISTEVAQEGLRSLRTLKARL